MRSYLDDSRRADLKQHHFVMGSHSTEYQTSAQKQFTQEGASSATNQGAIKIESKAMLKNSGQRIFGGNSPQQKALPGSGTDFQTVNQSYIKWIQPAPTQISMNMGGPSAPIKI